MMNARSYLLLLGIVLVCSMPHISIAQNSAYALKTVVIDAGHGGKDPGAIGKRAKEKDITLAIALKAGKYIEENVPNVKVLYTRTSDVFVELHKRAEIANKNQADLFISVHVNSSTNKEAYGTDSWIMGLHKNKANLEVAKLENKVITVEDNYTTSYQGLSADSTEAIIIHTMMQSANIEHSATMAAMVQNQFRERVQRKDRGVHTAPFMVLWKTTMPSILIETGFISNEDEETFLMSEQGQEYMASAIYRAFKEYKALIENKTNFAGIHATEAETTPTPENTKQNNVQPAPQTDVIEYGIQIAASKVKIEPKAENFKGLSDVYSYHEDGWYRYYTHKTKSYTESQSKIKDIKQTYPEAFIVARKNGKRISLHEAKKLTQ